MDEGEHGEGGEADYEQHGAHEALTTEEPMDEQQTSPRPSALSYLPAAFPNISAVLTCNTRG